MESDVLERTNGGHLPGRINCGTEAMQLELADVDLAK